MARYLGIDYGERRIGMAVSDPTGTIATALPTLVRRRGKRPPVAEILRIADELEVDAFVIGLPLTSDGDENEWTLEVRAFGDRLAERGGRPVHYVDERMTSARAERVVRGSGLPRSKRERKESVDAVAAVLILQAFLDRGAR
ncbi:MAG TPA: Holliday junction resolvase RuvX [Longimicrobiales bacterium]|nr:Holliday junction resolvase RuvX [Longimicrobiales bacterium]